MRSSLFSRKWLVGITVICSTIVFLSLINLGQYTVYFFTPKEAVAQSSKINEKVVRIGGMVKNKTVKWQPKSLKLKFVLSDLKGTDIEVFYKGAPPDMFKENSGVVVEGSLSLDGKLFTARNLFVKHSEEYRVPGDHQKLDTSLLQKSIIKDERSQ